MRLESAADVLFILYRAVKFSAHVVARDRHLCLFLSLDLDMSAPRASHLAPLDRRAAMSHFVARSDPCVPNQSRKCRVKVTDNRIVAITISSIFIIFMWFEKATVYHTSYLYIVSSNFYRTCLIVDHEAMK